MMELELKPRQKDFLNWRYGMFIHFGPYTWYPHDEYPYERQIINDYIDPNLFNPDQLDCEKWVTFAKSVGFKYIILTVIHQDNFCLWPTTTNSPSVATIDWCNGERDIVQEFVDACRKHNMKIGFYYNFFDLKDFCKNNEEYIHLEELLTNYGKIDYIFFDGHEAYRKKRDYKIIGKIIRDNQPDIILANGLFDDSLIFFDGEPDVSWIGNEEGEINSDYILSYTRDYITLANGFFEMKKMCVIPSSYVRIRTRFWFYTKCKEDKLKTLEQLEKIFNNTYKKNIALVINVGPNRHGLIEEDEKELLVNFYNKIKNEL